MNVPVPIKENFKNIVFYILAAFVTKKFNPCSKTLAKRYLKFRKKFSFRSRTIKVFISEVLNAF